MEELDLRSFLPIIRKRWWYIAAAMLIAVITALIVSFFFLQPVYQSDTSLYVGRDQDTQNTIAYNDLMLNTQLVNDYRELVKSRMISGMVMEELGLEDITSEEFAKKLDVSSKEGTRLIRISAQDEDPEMAMQIAGKVAEVFKVKAVEIMKVENIQIIDEAEIPSSPIKPDKKMNIAIAGVIGIMLGIGVIFVAEFMDNSVKTAEDVQKYTGLPVIGNIPAFSEDGSF